MLNVKDNVRETLSGGMPDRFVNQFEYFQVVREPILNDMISRNVRGKTTVGQWGTVIDWPEDQPSPVPNTRGDAKVIKDIARWKDFVNESNRPRTEFTDEEWAPALEEVKMIQASGKMVAVSLSSGVFEKIHNLMGMAESLEALYLEPEAMHELIDYMVEYEIEGAKEVCKHFVPELLFHPDDFGSSKSTFMSPDMFEEFFLPAYKDIYGFWKSQGVEVIVHHSDSFGATLVPHFIDMGVDVWQGVLSCNNIPELLNTYGNKITYMGGIDSSYFDTDKFNSLEADEYVLELCRSCGCRNFIPCLTQGGPRSIYSGVYDSVSSSIRRASEILVK